MSSSIYTYVGTPNSNLICCICHSPFIRPSTPLICNHTFCHDCIFTALSHSLCCPIDRKPLPLGPGVEDLIIEVGGVVKAMVDELLVECPHRAEGCQETIERQMVQVHLKEECAFGERAKEAIKKPEKGKDKGHEDERHQCPHSKFGCPFSSNSDSAESGVSSHLESCPYEALKDFISSNNAKVALLSEQNMILRHRLEMAENTVSMLNRDMGVLKSVLGPWYLTASSSTSALTAGPSSTVPTVGGVPPLEIGRTVEGTLLGVREGMLGLAGAIEGVGRRSEMGLANEALRLGEEMMCIRGQIHGLRMQIHGMMMERYSSGYGGFGGSGTTKL